MTCSARCNGKFCVFAHLAQNQELYHPYKSAAAVHMSDHISVENNPNSTVEKNIELICGLNGDTLSY